MKQECEAVKIDNLDAARIMVAQSFESEKVTQFAPIAVLATLAEKFGRRLVTVTSTRISLSNYAAWV